MKKKNRSPKSRASVPLKGQQREIFWSRFFSWIYSIQAPDFEAKRIFFSLSFSQSYQNIQMIRAVGYWGDSKLARQATAEIQNQRCSLLRLLSFPDVAHSAYVGYYFPNKSALQATATIQNQRCSLLHLLKNSRCSLQRLVKNPHCSLQRFLTFAAVAYSGDSMATARIQMSNFERLLTRLKGQ